MPKRNEPRSLCASSMVTIAQHFDRICYGCKTPDQMRTIIDDESFLKVQGPFLRLPNSMLTGLMDILDGGDMRFRMQKKHLHLLLLPHLETLKLSPTSAANNMGFDLVQKRCKRLRRLDMSYLSHVSPTTVVKLIPTLQQLVVLNMQMTEATDQILHLIGQHCPQIRDLDVSCCPITSQGIQSLCYDEETQRARAGRLLRLSVGGCMVSAAALGYLLHKIPSLKELVYENTFQIFNALGNSGMSVETLNSVSRTFSLTQLTSTDSIVSAIGAEIAVNLCPFATSVTISNSLIDNDVLYQFMNLQNLSHLRLTNNDSLSIDFYEGVLPILTVCGERLQSLLLSKFTSIDIAAIGECCPSLEKFAFSSIADFDEIMYPKDTSFTKLTAVEIWTDLLVETMSSVVIKQLLMFSGQLHNLLISGSQALTDTLFAEIWKVNSMKQLSRLTIDNCPNVSSSIFETILDAPNDLTLVRVWNCFLVSKKDNERLQKRIKNENCDTYLEWYPWGG